MLRILFYLITAFISLQCFALPARQGILHALQPDGTIVNIRMEGNAEHKRIYSEDGYLLTTDSLGFYVFADSNKEGEIIPSEIKAINPGKRNPETLNKISSLHQTGLTDSYKIKEPEENISQYAKGLGLGITKFPSFGEHRSLVILVEFSDKGFTIENPKEFYTRMLNEPGFSYGGATGSARDYFISNSNGIFIPQFDVYGPVVLEKPYSYYGRNSIWGEDSNPWDMVIEACKVLDDEVDFSLYDQNEDGFIDNVYIFYAGYGEADGGGANTIWPHSFDITAITRRPYKFDDVRLDHYACSNELQKFNNDMPDGIGTFCHEFSHVLGLPDLYSTTYNNAFTPSNWDILDQGSYNNYSRTPPNYSSYERFALDWINPEILYDDDEILLNPLDETNEAFIVMTDKDNEYFLFENRQQRGFDEFLPGHGMLIWHIDFNLRKWMNNTVNNTPSHQNVDLIEADDKKDWETLSGDAFPGTENVNEFSCQTVPSFVSWDNVNMPLRLYDISEDKNGIIRLSVEECKMAGMSKNRSEDLDMIFIEGNTVGCKDGVAEIFKINGNKVATLQNTTIELPSGIYIVVIKDRGFKFLIP
ncbi:MAG: M6 family metalloprotease domain-containing protein [Muribaculaceae bacterium]|nr:M6 family metalloprotease domain-containing protein [Muribaculaceae bacterium]